MTRARYLVQVREHGGAWRTACGSPARAQAEAMADVLAAQTRPAGLNGAAIPEFAYIRVTLAGSVVYEPRTDAGGDA